MKEIIDFYLGNYPSSTEPYLLSSDLGIINCQLNGGLFEENFIPEREIRETSIRGNSKPYFHGIDLKPLEFSLTFAFKDGFDGVNSDERNYKLRELARWLNKPYYIPFGIVGDERIFYVMAVDKSELFHNGMSQGYVTINFRCDAPWAYSKIKHINLGNIPTGGHLDFINNGDLDILPEIWITKLGTGEFKIVNESYGGKDFSFTELLAQETVYVNNEKEYIESDRPLTYRYDNFSNNYLSLPVGINRLCFYGDATVKFRYQERLLTI